MVLPLKAALVVIDAQRAFVDPAGSLIRTFGTEEAQPGLAALRRLLAALGVDNRPRLIALHDHNEKDRAPELVELARDQDVLVLSDAGMPTVSDPGAHAVRAVRDAGFRVEVIPGPSAVTTAVAVDAPVRPSRSVASGASLRSTARSTTCHQ